MKKISLIIVMVLFIISLVVGKIHWNNKIQAFSGVKSTVTAKTEKTETHAETSVESGEEKPGTDIMQYTKNLPDSLKTLIQNAEKEKKPIKLEILGSKSSSDEEDAWPSILKEQLVTTYGKNIFNITITSVKDKNSSQVIDEELLMDSIKSKPDVLLFEPFILKDNGEVRMEDRLVNIQAILDEYKKSNPNIIVFIQPSNPLFKASFYPKEVAELQRFAANNSYVYLDHWQVWPDKDSEELQTYLTIDEAHSLKSVPNEKGHQLWANFLVNYFISK